jgi:hypothetical protein
MRSRGCRRCRDVPDQDLRRDDPGRCPARGRMRGRRDRDQLLPRVAAVRARRGRGGDRTGRGGTRRGGRGVRERTARFDRRDLRKARDRGGAAPRGRAGGRRGPAAVLAPEGGPRLASGGRGGARGVSVRGVPAGLRRAGGIRRNGGGAPLGWTRGPVRGRAGHAIGPRDREAVGARGGAYPRKRGTGRGTGETVRRRYGVGRGMLRGSRIPGRSRPSSNGRKKGFRFAERRRKEMPDRTGRFGPFGAGTSRKRDVGPHAGGRPTGRRRATAVSGPSSPPCCGITRGVRRRCTSPPG